MEKCNQIENFKEKIKKQSIFDNKKKNAFNPSNDKNNKDRILNKITKNFNEDLKLFKNEEDKKKDEKVVTKNVYNNYSTSDLLTNKIISKQFISNSYSNLKNNNGSIYDKTTSSSDNYIYTTECLLTKESLNKNSLRKEINLIPNIVTSSKIQSDVAETIKSSNFVEKYFKKSREILKNKIESPVNIPITKTSLNLNKLDNNDEKFSKVKKFHSNVEELRKIGKNVSSKSKYLYTTSTTNTVNTVQTLNSFIKKNSLNLKSNYNNLKLPNNNNIIKNNPNKINAASKTNNKNLTTKLNEENKMKHILTKKHEVESKNDLLQNKPKNNNVQPIKRKIKSNENMKKNYQNKFKKKLNSNDQPVNLENNYGYLFDFISSNIKDIKYLMETSHLKDKKVIVDIINQSNNSNKFKFDNIRKLSDNYESFDHKLIKDYEVEDSQEKIKRLINNNIQRNVKHRQEKISLNNLKEYNSRNLIHMDPQYENSLHFSSLNSEVYRNLNENKNSQNGLRNLSLDLTQYNNTHTLSELYDKMEETECQFHDMVLNDNKLVIDDSSEIVQNKQNKHKKNRYIENSVFNKDYTISVECDTINILEYDNYENSINLREQIPISELK